MNADDDILIESPGSSSQGGSREAGSAVNSPSALATKREASSRAKDSQQRKKARLEDIKEIVEHLIVVGSHYRLQRQRLDDNARQEAKQEPVDSDVGANLEEATEIPSLASNTPPSPKDGPMLLHVEDNLIYGQNSRTGGGDSVSFWPAIPEKEVVISPFVSDEQWEAIWGDGVNPVDFSNHRLSTLSPEVLNSGCEQTKKQRYLEAPTIDPSQAPRSLLLRCWHRAVHAASQTAFASTERVEIGGIESTTFEKAPVHSLDDTLNLQSLDSSDASDLNQPTTGRPSSANDAVKFGPQRARQECQNLNIDLNSSDNWDYICPRCGTESGSDHGLESHFYGKPNARGCCWGMIQHRKESLLKTALEAEVLLQVRQLTQLVAMRFIGRSKQLQRSGQKTPKTHLFRPAFDWRHIHGVLKDFIDKSIPTNDDLAVSSSRSHLLRTIDAGLLKDTSTSLPLIPLNKFILETVATRLYERYNDNGK